jgi:hypothetical protein
MSFNPLPELSQPDKQLSDSNITPDQSYKIVWRPRHPPHDPEHSSRVRDILAGPSEVASGMRKDTCWSRDSCPTGSYLGRTRMAMMSQTAGPVKIADHWRCVSFANVIIYSFPFLLQPGARCVRQHETCGEVVDFFWASLRGTRLSSGSMGTLLISLCFNLCTSVVWPHHKFRDFSFVTNRNRYLLEDPIWGGDKTVTVI